MRLLIVASIAILAVVAGAIFGYTAVFFAYLWLHLPGPARVEFEMANALSLIGAVAGAFVGMIGGAAWGWRLTARHENGTMPGEGGSDERQDHPAEPSV